jgi:hypothetical protein
VLVLTGLLVGHTYRPATWTVHAVTLLQIPTTHFSNAFVAKENSNLLGYDAPLDDPKIPFYCYCVGTGLEVQSLEIKIYACRLIALE